MINRQPKYFRNFFFLCFLLAFSFSGQAQKFILNEDDSSWMKEPIPYKAMEKEQFKFPRNFYQNTITRFNFQFNTNEIFKRALLRARTLHVDDYDTVLTLLPYTISDFKTLKAPLDSVAENAGIGIQIHDQRANKIGDLFLLYGKANYYLEDYEEAAKAFEYMIKHLEERDKKTGRLLPANLRDKESDAPPISMLAVNGSKNQVLARNEAFVWLVRSYLQQHRLDDASALVSTLASDPLLPEKVRGALYATRANYAMENHQTDSVILSLEKALPLEQDRKLRARWQFILGQLYEQQKHFDKAIENYQLVFDQHPSFELKLYATLFETRSNIFLHPGSFRVNSGILEKMAKRERYNRYQSVIYYQLGKIALRLNLEEEALKYLTKSIDTNPEDQNSHYRSALLLADHFYKTRDYRNARLFYDKAAKVHQLDPQSDLRDKNLGTIVQSLNTIVYEDSLQTLAKMPEDSLMSLIDSLVADSIQSFKKQNTILSGDKTNDNQTAQSQQDSRSGNSSPGKKWYFYDQDLKSKGYSEFKILWGNRTLTDNWRLSNPNQPVSVQEQEQKKPALIQSGKESATSLMAAGYKEKLLKPLPLTKETFKLSENKEMEAREKIVNTLYLELRDDSASLAAIQEMLDHHPDSSYLPGLYYKLYLIYNRLPDLTKANYYKQLILSSFPGSKYAAAIRDLSGPEKDKQLKSRIENLYNTAYLDYLTGDYEKISQLQNQAARLDSMNEQKGRFSLLNAISILKSNSEEAGVAALEKVIRHNPGDTAVIDQARLIIEKVKGKNALIEHLLALQLPEREPEEKRVMPKEEKQSFRIEKLTSEKIKAQQGQALHSQILAGKITRKKMDSLLQEKLIAEAEAKEIPIEKISINRKKELETEILQEQKMTGQVKTMEMDSLARAGMTEAEKEEEKEEEKLASTPYEIEREVPHFVALAFRNTNAEIIKQTLDAFSRYNASKHEKDSVEVSSFVLAHNRVLLIFRLFSNEQKALSYYKELKEEAPREIIPGLPVSAYTLFFISRDNFILLNEKQDINEYLEFFYKHFK